MSYLGPRGLALSLAIAVCSAACIRVGFVGDPDATWPDANRSDAPREAGLSDGRIGLDPRSSDGPADTVGRDAPAAVADSSDWCTCTGADVNKDKIVNILDFSFCGGCTSASGGCLPCDLNADGQVNNTDLECIIALFGCVQRP